MRSGPDRSRDGRQADEDQHRCRRPGARRPRRRARGQSRGAQSVALDEAGNALAIAIAEHRDEWLAILAELLPPGGRLLGALKDARDALAALAPARGAVVWLQTFAPPRRVSAGRRSSPAADSTSKQPRPARGHHRPEDAARRDRATLARRSRPRPAATGSPSMTEATHQVGLDELKHGRRGIVVALRAAASTRCSQAATPARHPTTTPTRTTTTTVRSPATTSRHERRRDRATRSTRGRFNHMFAGR